MKVILTTLLIIVIAIIILFLYCALILAKRADNSTYEEQIIPDKSLTKKKNLGE